MRIITGEGEMLGVMSKAQALAIATEREMDLVLVSPKANPPVAKVIDFGQFRYQKEKEARKQKAKAKSSEVKAIRLSVRIGKHDLGVRMKQAEDFLKRKDKVKVEIVLRGRERAHAALGRQKIEEFVRLLQEERGLEINVEVPYAQTNNRLTMTVGLK